MICYGCLYTKMLSIQSCEVLLECTLNELFSGTKLITLKNSRDGYLFEYSKSAHLTLVAVDQTQTDPFYEKEHRATIIVSSLVQEGELVKFFRSASISISEQKYLPRKCTTLAGIELVTAHLKIVSLRRLSGINEPVIKNFNL